MILPNLWIYQRALKAVFICELRADTLQRGVNHWRQAAILGLHTQDCIFDSVFKGFLSVGLSGFNLLLGANSSIITDCYLKYSNYFNRQFFCFLIHIFGLPLPSKGFITINWERTASLTRNYPFLSRSKIGMANRFLFY